MKALEILGLSKRIILEKISNSDDQRTHEFSKHIRKFEVPHTLNLESVLNSGRKKEKLANP